MDIEVKLCNILGKPFRRTCFMGSCRDDTSLPDGSASSCLANYLSTLVRSQGTVHI